MLGIDMDKIEEMVHRMEQVAASMEESSKRVMEAAELMDLSLTRPAPQEVNVHIDNAATRQAALAELDRSFGRDGGSAR